MAKRQAVPLSVLAILLFLGGSIAAVLVWHLQLQVLDHEIDARRSALKRAHLTGKIPPNSEVADYLKQRTEGLKNTYESALAKIAPTPGLSEGFADPQLYFQQRVHEVQRTLERLASARKMEIPAQLGFPKELPPADAAPRLLFQLNLIEDASALIMGQNITQLVSVKVEDPEIVAPLDDTQKPFLTRLPVRIHLTCSLDTLTKVLGVLDRASPLIDLQSVRLAALPEGKDLDAELVLARYVVAVPELEQPAADDEAPKKGAKAKKG